MTAALHLAGPEHAALCLSLAAKYHDEIGAPYDDTHRTGVMTPLLDGSPLGAIWLIGPARAPMGYLMVTFDWSVEAGGMTGWIREVFIRDKVRRRGIGTESLHAVAIALRAAGVKALRVDVQTPDNPLKPFWGKAGFGYAQDQLILTDIL